MVHLTESEGKTLLLDVGSQDGWVSASLEHERHCNDPRKWDEEQGFGPSFRLATKDPL
jgi:hypothetical protein